MSNIDKIHNPDNIESHKDILVFLDAHLTSGYLEEAQARLKKRGMVFSNRLVYSTKSGERKNWKVLEVLAEIASENKAAKEKVEHIMNNN